MKQRFFNYNKDDYFRTVKLVKSTLFILGDTDSVIPWAAGPAPANYNRRAAIVFKTNLDLMETNCVNTDYLTTTFPLYTSDGLWRSDQTIFD